MRILGIETSCDETAAAIVDDGRSIRSSVVSSQSDLHALYGGVVPEIASRAHVELINDVIAQSLVEAGATLEEVDAVAAVHGPGLAGALLVGVCAGKAIALAAGRPYVGVNHHEAHVYAGLLEDPALEPPFVTLVVSGGHTLLIAMEAHGRYRVLGQTVDDAAGEAFDKVARFLGLGYPGGPAIDRVALEGDPAAIAFPRPMLDDGNDFSFSGLKTAVVQYVRKHPDVEVADVAASFQAAVVDVLVTKLLRVAEAAGVETIVIGGGVAANSELRTRLLDEGLTSGLRVVLPSISLCTDNAAMVAAVAWWRLLADGPTPLDAGAYPSLRIA
ncbi:MAG: tRNA N6-adenosine threonylcarbamoyltransferase [Actinomycetota bacterium]|nr:tRNA N6-adenosine threonylcarbamoyltransferase [Actinomycetota bacterium]